MTNNEFILCTTCSKCINLRIQMGFYPVPFRFECPECRTQIIGNVEFEPFKLSLENANNLDESHSKYDKLTSFPIWCFEISAELPTAKLYLRESPFDRFSPFISIVSKSQDTEKLSQVISSAMAFAEYVKNGKLANLERLYRLYWNRQTEYLYPELNKLLRKYKEFTPIRIVANRLDATMALHQLLLTTSGISYILGQDTLKEYNDLASNILEDEQKRIEIINYVDSIKSEFDRIEQTGLDSIIEFSKVYHTVIPVVISRNVELNDAIEGISSDNYEKLKSFYAKSYEWILDNLNLIIGMNNIFTRGTYADCCNGKHYSTDLERIGNKFSKINPNQSPYLSLTEKFSKPMESLKNKIRNAIQHYSSEVDYNNQKIIFTDRYGGREYTETYTLVEFINLCLDNFAIIFYILEILYTLRKLDLLSQGEYLTIWQKERTEQTHKIVSSNNPLDRKLRKKILKKRKK